MGEKPIFEIKDEKEGAGIPPTIPDSKYLGVYLAIQPENQKTKYNFTGPPGSATGLLMGLIAQLEKSNFTVKKVDEWIEVSPTHAQYYNLTVAQKQQLEGTIKTGLVSAAQAVADASLAEHDLRKYKEILDYFKEGVGKGEKKGSEHSLRAMFIDQVDVHTGDGVSLRSIVQRWPTIIADFMKLSEADDSIDKVKKTLKEISSAEAVILTTKNKLFIEWQKMFRQAAMERYEQLLGMSSARKKTISEYREWLKPFISRYRMIRLGHESAGGRIGELTSPYSLAGQAGFSNSIRIWAWKHLRVPTYEPKLKEMLPGIETERIGTIKGFMINPYDDFTRNRLILDTKLGLASIYPWLAQKDEKGNVKADMVVKEILKDWEGYGLKKSDLYYQLLDFKIMRVGSKNASFEFEDITFNFNLYTVSQNIALVKMLELYCREREFEFYIDEILGVKSGDRDMASIAKEQYPELYGEKKDKKQAPANMPRMPPELAKFIERLQEINIEKYLLLAKRGPYERDFKDTLTKYYFVTSGKSFGDVKSFLKEKMGVV